MIIWADADADAYAYDDVDDDCDADADANLVLILIKITCSFEVFQQTEEYQAVLDVARLGPKTLR